METVDMKRLLILLVVISPFVNAAEIVGTTQDNSIGEAFGSGVGVLVGGAAGGPVGALIGAGIGYLGGEKIQQGLGKSETAYLVAEGGSISKKRRNRLPPELIAMANRRESQH